MSTSHTELCHLQLRTTWWNSSWRFDCTNYSNLQHFEMEPKHPYWDSLISWPREDVYLITQTALNTFLRVNRRTDLAILTSTSPQLVCNQDLPARSKIQSNLDLSSKHSSVLMFYSKIPMNSFTKNQHLINKFTNWISYRHIVESNSNISFERR